MKKLIAVLSIVLFLLVSCQDSSSIVAPNSDSAIQKKETPDHFVPTDGDDSGAQDSQNPGLPRI